MKTLMISFVAIYRRDQQHCTDIFCDDYENPVMCNTLKHVLFQSEIFTLALNKKKCQQTDL